jgi:Ca-activated chloride channel family protein
MTFDNPLILKALFLIIPCFVIELGLYFVRAGRLRAAGLFSDELRRRAICSFVCFDFFLGCGIIAAAGPRWGTRVITEYHYGIDAVFAFDVSRSMMIDDVEPTRLGRAVEAAREAIVNLGGARLAIAMAKDRGVLAIPLTFDKSSLLSFLESLRTVNMTGKGTNIESLLDAAGGAFLDTSPAKRVIVLFTDGENFSGSLQSGVERAILRGISIVAVGMGTDEGGRPPDMILMNGSFAPVLDDRGKPVMSRRDSALLRSVAQRSRGVYVDGNVSNVGRILTLRMQELAPEVGASSFRTEVAPRWGLFIAAAILFFVLSKYAENRLRL